ncbi:hypothetical protein VOLCADRAFT_100442 [Volvox carteri f. nagariensis]|uniref:Pherophorin domain-containing protein n=1 Tax=Volvox carteri f. nagariensis TaxID=3068 RepID=D8UK79_VOLCA|nr:uncharacterized protein VOLCADRAFT_100442 [Volvox carteri f. nagariensis]EFJ39866.1 hypothetical protein VOLCADRAFT_100442 [Volvox carteri f. nagariensis]|eukprot:XP_002959072.1 hypothetical protein VOLCADRAFT_100442 [Volvox carteri f. nagariensis]
MMCPNLLLVAGLILTAHILSADAGRDLLSKGQAKHQLRGDSKTSVKRESSSQEDTAAVTALGSAKSAEKELTLQVAPWLLPAELLPGVAYFDAESGVTVRNGDEEAQIAATWADVFASRRPCNTMQLEGRCRLLRQGGAPAAVSFDGTSCTVTLDDYLSLEPAWEAAFWSPDFTAVWVMMQAEDARPKAFSFEGMLQCAVEDNASAASSGRGLPPLPSKQWTMEVLSKSTDEATGVVTQKYFRYSQAGLMSSQRLRQGPCGVLLPPSGLKSFAGDVAVVLLYDRAVEESEVRDLATFYGSRFGWRQELQQAQR